MIPEYGYYLIVYIFQIFFINEQATKLDLNYIIFSCIIWSIFWNVIFWCMMNEFFDEYKNTKPNQFLTYSPVFIDALMNIGINMFIIGLFDSVSMVLIILFFVMGFSDTLLGYYIYRKWTKAYYYFLVERSDSHDIIEEYSLRLFDNNEVKIRYYDFFDFFVRKDIKYTALDIFENKTFIRLPGVPSRNDRGYVFSLIPSDEINIKQIKSTLHLNDSHTIICIGKYEICGHVHVVHVETENEPDMILLFKEGSHYNDFVEKYSQLDKN